jgi:hypothetical protein
LSGTAALQADFHEDLAKTRQRSVGPEVREQRRPREGPLSVDRGTTSPVARVGSEVKP